MRKPPTIITYEGDPNKDSFEPTQYINLSKLESLLEKWQLELTEAKDKMNEFFGPDGELKRESDMGEVLKIELSYASLPKCIVDLERVINYKTEEEK